jgi:transposase
VKPRSAERKIAAAREALESIAQTGDTQRLVESAMSMLTPLVYRLDRLLHERYGASSERCDRGQLAFDFETAATRQEEPPASTSDEPVAQPIKEKSKHPGRRPLPASLLREEQRRRPTPVECVCEGCGNNKRYIREETSELLEYVPATFKVIVEVREVWACACGDGEVVTAMAGPRVIDGGLPGPGLLSQVIVSKFRDHMPFERQVQLYRRSGIDIPSNTMVDWVKAGAHLLQPIARRIFERILRAHVLQVDDTGLLVLQRDDEKSPRRGHIWGFVGDGREVAYAYTPNWEAKHPAALLAGRQGYLQVDGYKGYDALFRRDPALIHVGCWMHARRYFKQALDAGDAHATKVLDIIRAMYEVEAAAKAAGDSPAQRAIRRRRDTRPLLLQLSQVVAGLAPRAPPKTPMGKAIHYLTERWEPLLRFLGDGAIELDNGGVERALRGIAIGRKNWLFAGSDAAAERTAILCTVLQSAALYGHDPWAYLHDILQKLAAAWPQRRLDELLPHRWSDPRVDHHHATRITNTPPPSSSSSANRSSAIHD